MSDASTNMGHEHATGVDTPHGVILIRVEVDGRVHIRSSVAGMGVHVERVAGDDVVVSLKVSEEQHGR